MTIILFLIDTSASMCQKAYVNGVQKSYLDIAKGAVETFLKYRQRSQDCLGDRYMLLTFEDPPCNVKAGWKENHATFMNELKNLQSTGLTSMGEALKNAFDLLNLNRMQSGIDTYGQGRCPFYLEPSVIIVLTDGGKYSFRNGVHQDIILPLNAQIPGTKFTKEPFRWDQRLFSLVLRMSGNKIDERADGKVPHDDSPIERMCEVTGGRSYRIKSQYVLNQCIESLVQKVQPGVVLHFEPLIPKDLKDGEVQDIAFQTTKKMIYVQKHPTQKTFPVGYWPLPEPYWPDPKAQTLPPRDAHPKIRIITPCVDEPQIVRNFPVDKYEIEASPLTLQILSKKEPNKCWPVIIPNGLPGYDAPFGYLKANASFTQVYLFVLAYNYPALLPLVHDLIHRFVLNPPSDWMYKFSSYVRSIPQYYGPFLRRAFLNINVPYQLLQYMLPDNVDNYLSPSVANYLKQIKNTAKQEQENLCLRVYKQLKQPKPPYRQIETAKLNCGPSLRRDLLRNPILRETFSKLHNDITTFENYTIVVPAMVRQASAKSYRNPFDIPRRDLIDEIARMRENFLRTSSSGISLLTKDAGHCLPISEMGNYQEYLKNKETPLREIEPTNVRQHMFGNPYKKDKHMVMVDEADLGEVPPIKPNAPNATSPKKMEPNSRLRKRKAGPIRKDFIFRRTSTDSRTSTSSLGTMSDTEDDSMSDTASNASSDDGESAADRLMPSFDFNEPPDDFPINGHVRSFINGDFDDSEDSTSGSMQQNIPPPSPSTHLPPQIAIVAPNTSSNGILTNNMMHPPSFYGSSPIMPSSPTGIGPIVLQQHNAENSSHSSHLNVNNTIQSNGYGSVVPNATSMQNDINDAQEISKILQQCHNGSVTPMEVESSFFSSSGAQTTTLGTTIMTATMTVATPTAASTTTSSLSSTLTVSPLHSGGNDKQIENDISTQNDSSKKEIDDELSDEQKEKIKKHNLETRSIVFRDIRRPGRDYSLLLDHLNMVEGNFETKFNFIQMCINESLRFRRKRMADSIQEWWEKHIDSTLAGTQTSS